MPVLGVVDQPAFGVGDGDLLADVADLRFHLTAVRILILQLLRKFASPRGGAGPAVKPATSSSARKPALRTLSRPRRPCATRMRFSPVSGTTSATVAI